MCVGLQAQLGSRSYALEGCGPGCWDWMEQDRGAWRDETPIPPPAASLGAGREAGRAGNGSLVTVTVQIWYTPQFLALFSSPADLEVWADLLMLETNTAYREGGIPLRLMRRCLSPHPDAELGS